MNPESKPTWPFVLVFARLMQGSAKLLCVAVWFACMNRKVTVSPTSAEMFDGEYVSSPFAPTNTRWSDDVVVAGGAELEALANDVA